MEIDPEEMLLLKDAARRSREAIAGSHIFLHLLVPGSLNNPILLLHFGLAVMLDKPILLLAQEGTRVPENLRRLARYLEVVDFKDRPAWKAATNRLVRFAVAQGLMPEPGDSQLSDS